MRNLIRFITIIFFCGIFSPVFADTYKFISIADIHFDPFFDCDQKYCPLIMELNSAPYTRWETILEKYSSHELSGIGDDTNYPLLKTALSQLKARAVEIKPQFVFVLGDFLAHKYQKHYAHYSGNKQKSAYQAFVKKTLQFLSWEIKKTFPETEVYSVVGNNDSYTGNYHVVPQGDFFSDTAVIWSQLINQSTNKSRFYKTFPEGGYYAADLSPKLKLILLNTIYFSTKAKGPGLDEASKREFLWLDQQLTMAAQHNQKVWLAFHIPMNLTILMKTFWKQNAVDQFEKELEKFPGRVTAIFPAHIHYDIFQILNLNHNSLPVYFTPSISPILGNAIGYKVFEYDDSNFKIISNKTYGFNSSYRNSG